MLGNTRPLVTDTKAQFFGIRLDCNAQTPLGRGKTRGILQHIDQRLFDQRGMHIEQRQLLRHLYLQLQGRQYRAQALGRTGNDIRRGDPVTRQLQPAVTQAGHVQQVLDITVEALGLIAGAFQQLAAISQGNLLTQRQQAINRAAHSGQRRAQIMGDRGQQRAAQLLGLPVQARGLQILRQLRAFQGLGQGLAQRRKQTPSLGR